MTSFMDMETTDMTTANPAGLKNTKLWIPLCFSLFRNYNGLRLDWDIRVGALGWCILFLLFLSRWKPFWWNQKINIPKQETKPQKHKEKSDQKLEDRKVRSPFLVMNLKAMVGFDHLVGLRALGVNRKKRGNLHLKERREAGRRPRLFGTLTWRRWGKEPSWRASTPHSVASNQPWYRQPEGGMNKGRWRGGGGSYDIGLHFRFQKRLNSRKILDKYGYFTGSPWDNHTNLSISVAVHKWENDYILVSPLGSQKPH